MKIGLSSATHTNTHITYVSCVPKKKTWYLLDGDFTAPSGNSSIYKINTELLSLNMQSVSLNTRLSLADRQLYLNAQPSYYLLV